MEKYKSVQYDNSIQNTFLYIANSYIQRKN